MKRILLFIVVLIGSTQLWAQSDAFRAFAKKYDTQGGYEVTTVGRTAIRLATVGADRDSRKLMKKLDLLVSVKSEDVDDERLHEDFDTLVSGYDCVGNYSLEGRVALLYMNPARTGFALFWKSAEEQSILLLAGNDLMLDELLPKEMTQQSSNQQ